MNWIDRTIAFVSPQRAYEREMWRQELDKVRNYDAGDFRRGNANWHVLNESAELTDRHYRDIVRARARDMERNSDIMNAVVGAFKRNVVGAGYTIQARTGNEELNNRIEGYWRNWCKARNCDVTGTQSFNQILRMIVERKKIDGGILIHKVFTSDGLLPFKLQCLEVDELDVSIMAPHNRNHKVIGGIEVNRYNKPVGYWIKEYDPDGFVTHMPKYISAKNIIFIFQKRRPSQIREMSDMSQTVARIRDTNEFMTAVSVKERIAACLSVFIKRNIPSGNTLGRGTNKPSGEQAYDYNGKTLTPGMIMNLNPGDEAQTINPNGQSEDATGYVKLQQRLIGAGQGISYEASSRDMSETNYSSARQGCIEDDLTYAEDREILLAFMDEVYETFLISLVMAGKVEIKDFWENKDAYMVHEWIQAPKRWIDPLKESNANRIALQTGQKTFKQICAENGRDWKETIDDMKQVIEYGVENNMDMGGIVFNGKYEKNGSNDTGTDS